MRNRRCPNRKCCLDYECSACEVCDLGNHILKLHKRIDRLKKQKETLTIQRNAWALTAKATKTAVEKEIFDEIERLLSANQSGEFRGDSIEWFDYFDLHLAEDIAELKKKYTEEGK